MGILSLDGEGNVSGTESRFVNGTFAQSVSSGTITVNPDCSATVNLVAPDAAAKSITFTGMLSSDNKQMYLLQSDSGTAATGTMSAQ
ncbi:MAG TPA: hypothetical protein VGH38_13040 [Bryobacteraceae bacterium]